MLEDTDIKNRRNMAATREKEYVSSLAPAAEKMLEELKEISQQNPGDSAVKDYQETARTENKANAKR